MVMKMIEDILRVFLFGVVLMTSFASADFMEKTLATAGTATSLASGFPAQTAGNTYLLLNSSNSSDTQNITISYLTSAKAFKTATYALNGVTQVNTSAATNYVYNITGSSSAVAINLDVDNWTITSAGKNASLRCSNYTNVYHVEATGIIFTANMNATSASNSANTVSGGKAILTSAQVNSFVTTNNTYFSTIWYLYNPALNLSVYPNSTGNVLPAGEYFASTANFTAVSNLNYTWLNASNHSEGYNTILVTVLPNSDNRTYNVTVNATPLLVSGYVIIPSANLVQNKRVIVSALDASKCVNATLSKAATNLAINSSRYNQTGSIMVGTSDFAYVYGVKLSSAASGVVTVKNSTGVQIINVTAGNTVPNFGAQKMCVVPTGCTLKTLIFGGDGMIKTTYNVSSTAGVTRTAYSGWSPAGTMSNAGSGIVKWGIGETMTVHATPYVSSTNMSIYYEVG